MSPGCSELCQSVSELDVFQSLAFAATVHGYTKPVLGDDAADPSVVARWMSVPWPASPAEALADFVACDRFDVRVRLREVGVPAVVMVGERT